MPAVVPAVLPILASALALCATGLALAAQQDPPNPCDSLTIAHVRESIGLLRAAADGHRDSRAFTIRYRGEVFVEDHLMRPGMVRTVPITIEISRDAAQRAIRVRESSGPDDAPRLRTILIENGRAAVQPAADRLYVEEPADRAKRTIAEAMCWLPATALEAALEAAASCRGGLPIKGDAPLTPVMFTDVAGRAAALLLDEQQRLVRIERLEFHQRLGDVCHWTNFDQWQTHEGLAIAGRLSRFIVHPASTVRFNLSLVEIEFGGSPPTGLPEANRGDIPDWGDALPTDGFERVPLAAGLWSVEIAAADARVVVMEGDDHLVVLGAPDGDAVCSALKGALEVFFPGKPVRSFAFGHHHPSPSGGLRALAASGAALVAPRNLEPYIREHLQRPTTLGAPAIAAPAEAVIEFFDDETTIRCGENSVRLIDIGERSAHTFCYIVFYFPESGIIFQDDLAYFPLTGATRPGPRLRGLAAALAERGITPERMLQLWPVRGVHREVSWASVAELLAADSR